MSTLLTKSTLTSAALHLSILGGVGSISVLTLDQAPVNTPQPIAIHFVKAKSLKTTIKKIKAPKLTTKPSSKKQRPTPTSPAVQKCSVKSVQTPPVDITTIACEGAYMPQPVYPKYALRKKLTGLVKVHFNLNKKGLVASVKIIKSSTHRSLDQAALDTIKAWIFPTHIAEKHPSLMVPIRFILS